MGLVGNRVLPKGLEKGKREMRLIKANWENFKAKFSENPQDNFEWFCYLLFLKEYNQPYGTHRYKNQSGIETDPIKVGDEVIGWQSKFYEDTLSNHKEDLLGTLRKTKRDNPNITKIILYTNSEWGQGQGTKEPKAKTETEEKAKELKIKLIWRVQSYFESPFVCQEQKDISSYFFELDTKWELTNLGFRDKLIKEYENTFKNSYNNLDTKHLVLEKRIKTPSEIRNGKNRKIDLNNFVNISNKSLIITEVLHIKNNFSKSIAYLWSQGEIYQGFKYVIYLSLKKWKTGGLKSLIRDNYYALDNEFIILDIKKNKNNILFLFDGLDILNWEKREDILKEINEYSLKYYLFITSKKRGVFVNKELEFDESFSLSSLRLENLIEEKDYFPFKVKVFNYLQNYFETSNIEFSIAMDSKLYSEDIEENLFFDIIIEIYFPLESLIVIKCFDSAESISLQNIQNFYNQKKEVNAQKIILVSPNIFEQNIIQYAEKRKREIGLLNYEDIHNSEWLLRRSPSTLISWKEERLTQANSYNALRHGEDRESLSMFMVNLFSTNGQKQIFSSAITLESTLKNRYRKVKFLNDELINQFVNKLLSKINYEKGMINFEKIGFILEKEHNLNIHYNRVLEADVLGEIDFGKSLISIDNHQCETLARMRFTVAHEIGHYILGHARYMYGEKYTKIHNDKISSNLSDNRENIVKMEWQANQFASFLLLPIDSLLQDLNLLLKEFDVRDKLYVDNQRCNIDTFMQITNRLMHKYKVSRAVVEIRLKKLGLLHKNNTYEFVKNIHQEIGNKKINWNYND